MEKKIWNTSVASVLLVVLVGIVSIVTGVFTVFGGRWVIVLILLLTSVQVFSGIRTSWLVGLAIAMSSLIVYRWDIGVAQVSIYRLFLLISAVQIAKSGLLGRRRVRQDDVLLLLAAMLAWDMIGILYSNNPRRGVQFVAQETEFIVAYFVIINAAHSLRDLSRLVQSFLVSVSIAMAFGVWQWLNVFVWEKPFQWPFWQYVRLDENAKWLDVTGAWAPGVNRVSSVIGDPANFAILLALGIALVLTHMILTQRITIGALLFLLGASAMLLASGGRIGLINTVVSVVLLVIWVRPLSKQRKGSDDVAPKRRINVFFIVLLAIMAVVSVWLSQHYLGYDLWEGLTRRSSQDIRMLGVYDDGSGSSLARRLYLMRVGMVAWSRSPLLGIGTGSLLSRFGIQGVHNTWVLRLAENGIVGFFIIVAIAWKIIRNAIVARRSLRRKWSENDANNNQIWAVTFIHAAPVLVVQLLVSWALWGYWWQPFYVIMLALLGVAYRQALRFPGVNEVQEVRLNGLVSLAE